MGMIYRKGHFYGGGTGGGGDVEVDNSVIISYEEYLNLSEEEKNSDTTYFVPDYPAGLNDPAEIVDNLESTDPNKALSANMGRELNQKLSKVLYVKSFDPETGILETVSGEPVDDDQEV